MKNIHAKIRCLRVQKGYSQEYMALSMGLSQKQYGRLENGESKLTIDHLGKICETLGIDPADLFDSEIYQESHNQQGGNANIAYLVVNEMSEKLIESYERRLADKDEEIRFLRSLLTGDSAVK